ncbi:MAG: hypothetical protein SOW11_05830, partial [Campylobacter lanienae]|nr:hypothetical protein [Campylobacter lanienae]
EKRYFANERCDRFFQSGLRIKKYEIKKFLSSTLNNITESKGRVKMIKDREISIVIQGPIYKDITSCVCGSTILKNSYIPSGCIVGKSAVVAKKFEKENVIIAKNPTKIIKENILWDRKSVNEVM